MGRCHQGRTPILPVDLASLRARYSRRARLDSIDGDFPKMRITMTAITDRLSPNWRSKAGSLSRV
jgi:hypothetical protein